MYIEITYIRVIGKVRKRQHQDPVFGHIEDDEISKNTGKKSTLSFNQPITAVAMCTITINVLESRAFNLEF
jgi:hypothetical protein